MFEKTLIKNVQYAFKGTGFTSFRSGALIVGKADCTKEEVHERMKTVIGANSFSIVKEIDSDIEVIKQEAIDMMKDKTGSIAVRVNRIDKKFPLKSQEIGKEVGSAIYLSKEGDFSIDLTNPDHEIFVHVDKTTFIYSEKIPGYAGLPVGSSGKVLSLFSGGIDSVVAAHLMMRRGCRVDLVHFHNFADGSKIKDTKVEELANFLAEFQMDCKLYLVPYPLYEVKAGGKIDPSKDLVLFKYVLLHFADLLARQKGYGALVTGDSLGQVASQTLENIQATRYNLQLPLFAPLIGMNKEEITQISRRIGAFDMCVKKYTDCCSLMATNPDTKVRVEGMKKILQQVDVDGILESLMAKTETRDLKLVNP